MADISYNVESHRWEIKGYDDEVKAAVGETTIQLFKGVVAAVTATIQNLNIGTLATLRAINSAGVGTLGNVQAQDLTLAAGTKITLFSSIVGTTPATTVGTGGFAVATMSGMENIAITDKVYANPKAALSAGLSDLQVAGAGNVQVRFVNPSPAAAVSQAAVGWDVLAIRS